MIDSIRIKNFQGHGALTLDFTPGINTLVGDSDAGKSTVLRAIKWVAQNRPSGDENTKHGETDCRVMVTSQGHKATRFRTPTKNGYKLDDRPEYLAVNKDVPPDVAQALQLADVNFQAQSDGWFWFSLSAGERSRELNKVVDLDAIDIALTKLAGIAKKRQTAVEVAQDRHKAAGLALEALNHVPALQARVTHLECLEADAVDVEAKAVRLQALWTTAAVAGEARRKAEQAVKALESLVSDVQVADVAESKALRLRELVATITSIKIAVLPTEEQMQQLMSLDTVATVASGKAERLRQHLITIATAHAALAVPVPTEQWERVMELHTTADAAESKASRLRQVVSAIAGIKLKALPTEAQMQTIVDAEAAAVAAAARADALRATVKHISGLAVELHKAAEAVAAVEAELATIPVCPTCGKPTGDCDG